MLVLAFGWQLDIVKVAWNSNCKVNQNSAKTSFPIKHDWTTISLEAYLEKKLSTQHKEWIQEV